MTETKCDGCRHEYEADLPPRPSDEWLAERGVRIVGDGPRLPVHGERFYSGPVIKDHSVANWDYKYNEFWIVEPIPEPEPVGEWVECVVSRDGKWWEFSHQGMLHTLFDALGMVGFGGILYEALDGQLTWHMHPVIDMGCGWLCVSADDEESAEAKPATPIKVRFWQEGAAK